MNPPGWDLLFKADDLSFCELLVTLLEADGNDLSETLYRPDVLLRLRNIRDHNALEFFSAFMIPVRAQFAKRIHIGDLFTAMDTLSWDDEGLGGVIEAEEFAQASMAWVKAGDNPGHNPGWHEFGTYYTIRPGELTVVTGTSGHFKTTFIHSIAMNLAMGKGWKFAIFSQENAPLGQLGTILARAWLDSQSLSHTATAMETAINWVSRHFFPIMSASDDIPPTVPWILGVARQYIESEGIQGLIIDPWNAIDHRWSKRIGSEPQYISEALSHILRICKNHLIHTWLIAHPTKLRKDEKGRYAGQYPPPTPYDISGAAHFFTKADNCLCIWRDMSKVLINLEIHIQKVKHRVAGRIGKVDMVFQDGRFEEVSVGYEQPVPF